MASVDDFALGQADMADTGNSRSTRRTSAGIPQHVFPPTTHAKSPSPPPYSPGGLMAYDEQTRPSVSTQSPPTTALSRFLRRAPFLSHVIFVVFVIFGPEYSPRFFVALLMTVSLLFLAQQYCGLKGTWDAMRLIRVCANKDWKAWAAKEKAIIRASMSDSEIEQGLLAPSDEDAEFDDIEHLILIPNYKEDLHTLTETLTVLASHPVARTSYRVCLGMEIRERGSESKARSLLSNFSDSFLQCTYTLHPGDIPGEAAGKSSNLAWASREMAKRFARGDSGVNGLAGLRNMIITVLDSDTCLAADWFAASAAKFCVATPEKRRAMMFVAPIVFDRNANDVPAPVRITDMFWSLAGMSSTYNSSSVKIPTSAYGISMSLAMRVGFWDAGPESIGEDMHMYLKCFFGTAGNIHSETIYSPASQTDVLSGNRGGLAGYGRDCYARYEQALRHMFGAMDSGYSLNRLLTGDFRPAINASAFMFTDNEVSTPAPTAASPPSILLEADPTALFPIEEEDGTLSESTPSLLGLDTESTVSSVGPDTPCEAVMGPSNPSYFNAFPSSKMTMPMIPMHGPLRMNWNIGRNSQSGRGHTSGLSWSKAKRLLATARTELQDNDETKQSINVLKFCNVFVKLYQAHFMLTHLAIFTILVEVFPLRSNSNPILASINLSTSAASSIQAQFALTWTLKDFIVVCGMIRLISVPFTILSLFFYDSFHNYAAVGRWKDAAASSESRFSGPAGSIPSRLGVRASELSVRKYPFSCLDWLCIPLGLIYGLIPMVHAQFIHVYTDNLAYKTSAKPMAKTAQPALRLDTTDSRRS